MKTFHRYRVQIDGIQSLCWSEWSTGRLTLPLICMVFVLFSLLITQSLTGILSATLKKETNQFLAADAILTSHYPIPSALTETFEPYELDIAKTLETRTVLISQDKTLLVSLKATDDAYPIKPGLRLFSSDTGSSVETASNGPQAGEAWVDPAILDRLGLSIGDVIDVGHTKLTISRVIEYEPDRSMRFYSLNPRLMISMNDIESTGIVHPASRVTYTVLIGGDPSTISQFIDDINPELDAHQTLEAASESNAAVDRALTRANNYLLIIGGLSAGIALAGLWLVLDRVARRLTPTIATLRCLGFSKKQLLLLLTILLTSLLVVSLITSLVMCVLAAELLSITSMKMNGPTLSIGLGDLFSSEALLGSILLVLGIGWLQLNSLLQIPPSAAIHTHFVKTNSDSSFLQRVKNPSLILPLLMVTMGALLYIIPISEDLSSLLKLVCGGFIILGAAFTLAWLLTKLVWVRLSKRSIEWEMAVAQWLNLPRLNHFQVALFSIIVMSGAVIFILKGDLFDRWQKELPEDTPNYFVTNLFTEDLEPFEKIVESANLKSSTLYPIIRGRLIKNNGKTLRESISKHEQDSVEALERELNLTWSKEIPEGNKIIAGQWWEVGDYGQPNASIEEELADKLSIKMGDTLTLSLAGETVEVTVTNIRSVDWESFTPNFYIMVAPGFLANQTATYMASLYIPPNQKQDITTIDSQSKAETLPKTRSPSISTQIVQQFPHITLYSVGPLLQQLRKILSYVASALSSALIFLSLTGTLLLITMIFASWDERQQTLKTIRILGASRSAMLRITIREYWILAFSVASIGCVGGELIAAVLAQRLFEITPVLHPSVWIAGYLWVIGLFLGVGWTINRISSK